MFFSSAEIEEDLQCSFCKEKLVNVVKLIPNCGESICGFCYETLIAQVDERGEFRCRACNGSHKMPEEGLTDNKSINRILKRRKIEKPLSQEATRLKRLVRSVEVQLSGLQSFDEQCHINYHCDQLEIEVAEEIDSLVKHLNEIENDLLKQINEYRNRCLEALSVDETRPVEAESKKLKKELDSLAMSVTEFGAKWNDYFSRLDSVEKFRDIENALDTAKNYEKRMDALSRSLRKNALGGRVMSLKVKHSFHGAQSPLRLLFVLSTQHKEIKIRATPSQTLTGHTDWCYRVIFLSSGRIASCSRDKTVKVWNVLDGSMLYELKGHTDFIGSMSLLMNGWLATGSDDTTIKIWDLESTTTVRTMIGHTGSIVSLRALPNGNLASYSTDDTIRIWNPLSAENNLLRTITGHGNTRWVLPLGVLQNGDLVTCTRDNKSRDKCTLFVWSANNYQFSVAVATALSTACAFLVLSNDNIAVGFQNGTIQVVNLKDGAKTRIKSAAHRAAVTAFVQLSNGNLVTCGSYEERNIKMWTLPDFSLLQTITSDHSDLIDSMSLSPNEELLVTGSRDKTIKLWPIITK